jgi:hypothetical protein
MLFYFALQIGQINATDHNKVKKFLVTEFIRSLICIWKYQSEKHEGRLFQNMVYGKAVSVNVKKCSAYILILMLVCYSYHQNYYLLVIA